MSNPDKEITIEATITVRRTVTITGSEYETEDGKTAYEFDDAEHDAMGELEMELLGGDGHEVSVRVVR